MLTTFMYVKNELPKHVGNYPEIASQAKVSYSWLAKVATGAIKNPGSVQIDRVARVLKKRGA
jgi:hypothetical protein